MFNFLNGGIIITNGSRVHLARELSSSWALAALGFLLWVKTRSQLHTVVRCDPVPLVPVLSRGAERNLNQPQQLRQKPHQDVTSDKDRPTSFYAKIILRRPGDKEWWVPGFPGQVHPPPSPQWMMSQALGKAFVARELLNLLARLQPP